MDGKNIVATRKNKVIYRDGNCLVKLFGEEFSKSGVFSEALNLAYAEETGLNVPRVLDIKRIDGKWAIVSEFIEGTSLEQLMENEPEKTDYFMELFTDLQLEVSKKRCPMMCRFSDKVTEKIRRSDIRATLRYDLYTRLRSMEPGNDLCHGDFVPSNIIIGPDGKKNIIDWSHSSVGPAPADAAKTYLILKVTKKDNLAEKYIKLYSEKSKVSEAEIKKWIPLAAASYGIKGSDDEKRFIDACINLTD